MLWRGCIWLRPALLCQVIPQSHLCLPASLVQSCNLGPSQSFQQQLLAGIGTAAAQRHYAANAAGPLSLKSALRELYKRVHPDLFTDYPAEQAENERSFKLLQDYLYQARNPSTGPTSRTAYHFRFFLTPQAPPVPGQLGSSTDDEPGPAAAADSPQFELVQLVLVPPPPPRTFGPSSSSSSGSGSGSGPISAGARQGLLKLLQMCGLGEVEADADEQQAAAEASARLTTFLPEAAEVVRQHESGPTKHETRVANMRAAFRLARAVIAGFQPGMFTGPQQIEHLQRLAHALDLLSEDPSDLSGLHILICGKTALDSQGTLCLDAAADVEEWAGFLGGVDPDYARDKKASADAVRSLEGQVAAAVGVRMLFTAAPYLMTHPYRSFLERLAAHAAASGPVTISRSSSSALNLLTASSIPIYVAPTYQLPAEQQHQQQVVHEVVGYIQVPMQAAAQQVYSTIQAHAPAALAILSRKAAEQAELSELISSVRTRLGLRRLLKDDIISLQDFRNACRRLLINRDALLQSNIEGLSIRVSDKNRVAPDGSLVDIAWDFDM